MEGAKLWPKLLAQQLRRNLSPVFMSLPRYTVPLFYAHFETHNFCRNSKGRLVYSSLIAHLKKPLIGLTLLKNPTSPGQVVVLREK